MPPERGDQVSAADQYNEDEWLTAENPRYLHLILRNRKVDSNRKFRLVAVAFCRRVWDILSAEGRRSVETAEQHADNKVPRARMLHVASVLELAVVGNPGGPSAARAARGVGDRQASTALYAVTRSLLHELWTYPGMSGYRPSSSTWHRKEPWEDEVRLFCRIMRDVFGNPFCPVGVESAWLTWKDSTVVKLAQGIYEDRAFERLPMLADALEDAGCGDAEMLAHCRGPGPHVRGCWVVDLLLGKR
jgi:hypothetical protein